MIKQSMLGHREKNSICWLKPQILWRRAGQINCLVLSPSMYFEQAPSNIATNTYIDSRICVHMYVYMCEQVACICIMISRCGYVVLYGVSICMYYDMYVSNLVDRNDHTTMRALLPVCSAKLYIVRPGQYYDGGPLLESQVLLFC